MNRSASIRGGIFCCACLWIFGAFANGQSPPLKQGDTGAAVERLQKLLNARLDPSPELDVDGDFGAATLAALRRFQRQKGLPATGEASAKTWEMLGTLTPAEEVPARVPPPADVNGETIQRKPPDSLDGPPFTTAKAWAIADGKTGRLLFGYEADKPREMASTTKMMTALIVARLAAGDSKVLDETVVFSRRADGITGSTSGVKEGESVSVGELLYGLMLPSGNDAAVAFAEHFGNRFAPPDSRPDEADPVARFVAEMNRTARSIGLAETHFANPNGLPARDHHASARDLAKLASLVLADPTLARVVSTSKRGATLRGPADGQTRNVVWKNTNVLLSTEGYDGVKTGTTNAAGNCLVASGHRDGRHRIVVVLGCTASDGRYVDARNLFRWAWHQP